MMNLLEMIFWEKIIIQILRKELMRIIIIHLAKKKILL